MSSFEAGALIFLLGLLWPIAVALIPADPTRKALIAEAARRAVAGEPRNSVGAAVEPGLRVGHLRVIEGGLPPLRRL